MILGNCQYFSVVIMVMFEKILLENTQIFIDEKISMVCFKNLVG